MAANGAATGARLLCGLGGSLDVFAGVVERAPKFWSDHGLEWFYRLCKEPRRIRPHDEAPAVPDPCEAGEKTKMKGKLIVFEGTDGSGKATQAKLLCATLTARGLECREIDFPRTAIPLPSRWTSISHGALGNRPGDVNAYAASVMFAVDRFASYKEDWGGFYERGGIVVANRYTTSNAVHQASKLAGGGAAVLSGLAVRPGVRRMGLPEPDLVLYLDMPTEVTEKMLRHREEATATAADIHEQDGDYLRRCRESARQIARDLKWSVVDCAAGDAPRTVEDIRREVLSRGGEAPGIGPVPCPESEIGAPGPHLRTVSAAAAAAAVIAATAATVPAADGAAAAAAATDQDDDEDDPKAGAVVVSVVEAHVLSPRFETFYAPYPPKGAWPQKKTGRTGKIPPSSGKVFRPWGGS